MRTPFYVILLLWVTACSPSELPHLPSIEPARWEMDHIQLGDGTKLPLRIWQPERGAPKTILVALHGFNDYSNAFESSGQYFREHGVMMVAYDQRGFGRVRSHGIWAGQQNLTSDLKQVVSVIHERYPETPLYLLGESMGGAVVMVAMAQPDFPRGWVRGAILSAPAVWGDETMNGFYRMTLWLMAHTVPGGELTGEGLKIMASDNIEMLRAMSMDPLVVKSTRIDAVYGIVQLMDQAYKDADKVNAPLLLLYGANDQVIPPEPIKKTAERLKAEHRLAYYPDGYHMLLRDLKAEVVRQDILGWMKDPKLPLASGYDTGWDKKMKPLD